MRSTARNPRPRYRVTDPTHIAAFLKRILPTRAMDRIVGRTRKPDDQDKD